MKKSNKFFLILIYGLWPSLLLSSPLPSYRPDQEAVIILEAKGSHEKIITSSDYSILVRYSAPLQMASEALPLNLAIVIDRSGSMAEKGKIIYGKNIPERYI